MMRLLFSAAVVSGCAAKLDPLPDGGIGGFDCTGCVAGATRCTAGAQEQLCEDLDGDGCATWSTPYACASGVCEGQTCRPACEHDCALEEGVCEAGLRRVCVADPETGCRVLSAATPCGEGERCDDGRCVDADAGCMDACPGDGVTECTAGGARGCGQYDEDLCWEWSATRDCGVGAACEDGACVLTCEDACAPGRVQCAGDGVARCADHDGDGCVELGAAEGCGVGRHCEQGQCIDDAVPCADDCASDGDARCVLWGFETCRRDHDADDCLEWGGFRNCDWGEWCVDERCVEIDDDDHHHRGNRRRR